MDPMDVDDDVPAASAAALPCATRGPFRLGNLLNPYLTRAEARQLDETVDEFLARLPPHPISANSDTLPPWYWIANPHLGLEYYRQPEDPDTLKRQGQNLLDRYRKRKTAGNAFLPRHVTAELEKEIAELAKATGIVVGKVCLYFLFPLMLYSVTNLCYPVDALPDTRGGERDMGPRGQCDGKQPARDRRQDRDGGEGRG
jgi:hypothetical protein